MNSSVPASWGHQKRKAGSSTQGGDCKKARTGNVDHLGIIEAQLKQHIQFDWLETVPEQTEYDSKTLLESIPFCRLLSTINSSTHACHIPVVSRVYEERYMRECVNKTEGKCVMDRQCECMMIDPKNPFVGVQFHIPNVEERSGGMCVLCLRKLSTLLFFQTIHKGIPINTQIQRYGNICNEENEYHPSVMLVCPPNGPVEAMPLPIVAHQRNRYEVVVTHGIRYLKQNNVGMSDFR